MSVMKKCFDRLGMKINGITHLSAREAVEAISRGAVILDIRDEYQAGMKTFKVANYVHCPLEFLDHNIEAFPKDKCFIVADATGLHSKEAALKLMESGIVVANLAGGIMDWERDGYPVDKDPKEQLSGQCPCMLKPMNKKK